MVSESRFSVVQIPAKPVENIFENKFFRNVSFYAGERFVQKCANISFCGLYTPLVTWDGKDLTVESSEMIDRVVVLDERHEVADTVAVIALDANRGIVDVTVETETREYNCEVDTDA